MQASCLGENVSDESRSLEEEESFWVDNEGLSSDEHVDGSESLFSRNLRKYADYLERRLHLPMSNHPMEDE